MEAPISEFECQVLCDHPELSSQEAKIVASTLLRCSEYANQFGALLNMHAESSTCDVSNAVSSTAERLSLSGSSDVLVPGSLTPCMLLLVLVMVSMPFAAPLRRLVCLVLAPDYLTPA